MAQSKPPFGTPLNSAHWASQGLVLAWLFNEGSGAIAYDSSGQGHNGTFSGSTLPQWGAGYYGSAITFPAANSMISATVTSLGVTSSSAQTVVMGVKSAAAIAVNRYAFLLWNDASNYWQFWTQGGPAISTYRGQTQIMTSEALSTHYLLAASYTADGVGTIYSVNGVQNTFAGSHGGGLAYNTLYVGNIFTGANPWDGNIDFYMLWNRALSASEISYLSAFPFCMFDPLYQNVRQIYSIPRNVAGKL